MSDETTNMLPSPNGGGAGGEGAPTWLDLYDYRRRTAQMYAWRAAQLYAGADDEATLIAFRAAKDTLFKSHPQSPFDAAERASFGGLRYFPYDHTLRVIAELAPEPETDDAELPASGPHTMRFRRAARVRFTVDGAEATLPVYWIDVYGGGLFLPFRDATCPDESYGAGRYLFDTVKGSDFLRADANGAPDLTQANDPTAAISRLDAMGDAGGRIILDFNYAYNPSCAYDPRWACPLAPAENRLPMPIRAGERKYHDE